MAKNIATVYPLLFLNLGLWYHYFDGIIPLNARFIATVHLPLFNILGLWYYFLSGILF